MVLSDPAMPLSAASVQPVRLCLSLCAGGVGGVLYQIGCLAALEDALEGFSCNEFDLFVGTGGGALLAATLAGGVEAHRWYRAMLDPVDDFFPVRHRHFLQFDGAEWRRPFTSAVQVLSQVALGIVARPMGFDLWREIERFYDSLPAGILSLAAYEDLLERFFARRGVPNHFGELTRRLVIPAYDLDSGHRVAFGQGDHAHVPIAKAICASSAVPMLFAPIRIGDRDYISGSVGQVAHLDVAASAGASLVVVVNPMVPVRNDPSLRRVPTGQGPMPRVRDKGLLGVFDQAGRIGAQSRLELEQGYHHGTVAHHTPRGMRLVQIEPHPTVAAMFWYPLMDSHARRTLLQYGYDRTMAYMRREAPRLRAVLQDHRI